MAEGENRSSTSDVGFDEELVMLVNSHVRRRCCTDIWNVPCCYHEPSDSLGCLCGLCVWFVFGVFHAAVWSYTVQSALMLTVKFIF
jgi:hypothetical protein